MILLKTIISLILGMGLVIAISALAVWVAVIFIYLLAWEKASLKFDFIFNKRELSLIKYWKKLIWADSIVICIIIGIPSYIIQLILPDRCRSVSTIKPPTLAEIKRNKLK